MNVRKAGYKACEVTDGDRRLALTIHRAGQIEVSTSGDGRVGITQYLDFADARMLHEALTFLLDRDKGGEDEKRSVVS